MQISRGAWWRSKSRSPPWPFQCRAQCLVHSRCPIHICWWIVILLRIYINVCVYIKKKNWEQSLGQLAINESDCFHAFSSPRYYFNFKNCTDLLDNRMYHAFKSLYIFRIKFFPSELRFSFYNFHPLIQFHTEYVPYIKRVIMSLSLF